MKTNVIRALLLLLCCCMILGAFAGCQTTTPPEGPDTDGTSDSTTGTNASGDDETTAEETTEEETTEEETEPVEQLPDVQYNKEFVMYMRKENYYISEQYIAELTGQYSIVDAAVYFRNLAVEERFGVEINIVQSTDSNLDTSAMESIKTNNCNYDVIVNHGRAMFTYAMNNTLADWNDLPYVDLTKPWWNQGMINDFTVNGVLYCLAGDISYQSLGATVGMIFNKDVCDMLEIDMPYDLVLDNEWTWAEFKKMTEMANQELSGNDTLKPEDGDVMGYMTSYWRGPMTVLYAGGGSIVSKNDAGTELELTLYSARNEQIFSDYFDLLSKANNKLYYTGYSIEGVHKTFAKGKVLFMDTRLYDIRYIVAQNFSNYGVIPWPKYDEFVEEYYSWCDAVANTFGVPKCHNKERLEYVSVILEALCAEGYREVLPTFYEDVLQSKYANDPDAFDCIDLIKAGRRYDIASYMQANMGAVSSPGPNLIDTKTGEFKNFTNWYGGVEATAKQNLKLVNKLFELVT